MTFRRASHSGWRCGSTELTTSQLINENVFEWSVALIVMNEESMYYGGYFKAKMTFPRNYPHSPPGMSLPIRRFQQGKSREAQGRS